jgi:acetyl esterase/lipase
VRELAVGARAALAFVEYPNSPEAHYPVAVEQGYATAQWITRNGASKGLDASRMAVAGESAGGSMTAALALMAKERGDVTFVQQLMHYPMTDAAMDTASYEQFATAPRSNHSGPQPRRCASRAFLGDGGHPPLHVHDLDLFYIVLEGSATVRLGHDMHEAKAGGRAASHLELIVGPGSLSRC